MPWPSTIRARSTRRAKPILSFATLGLALLFLSSTARSQSFTGFDDFLRRLETSSPESRQQLTDSFARWQQERGGFPIVEQDGNVVFFFRGTGEEQNVRVTGDFRPSNFFNVYWDSIGDPLTRVGSIYYRRYKFEPDARLDYKFIVDGRSRIDSLNARRLISGVGGGAVSELVMRNYRSRTETMVRPGIPQGSLHVVTEPWATPKVTIYLPPGYDRSREYPSLYTADGGAWVDLLKLPLVLDNLIANRVIEPVIAVMIDATSDRSTWYYYNPDYLAYLKRVIEYVDGRYATRRRASERMHAGSSAGGRAALYSALELPQLFANVGMLSPSVSGPPSYYEPYFSGRKRPDRNLQLWLSAGTYEGAIQRDAQTMEAYFKKVGVRTRAVYVHQGHSFGAWRDLVPQMLEYFFPTARAARE